LIFSLRYSIPIENDSPGANMVDVKEIPKCSLLDVRISTTLKNAEHAYQEHVFKIFNHLHTRSLYSGKCCIAGEGDIKGGHQACDGWPIPYSWAWVSNIDTYKSQLR
jgi:hypothetical protein